MGAVIEWVENSSECSAAPGIQATRLQQLKATAATGHWRIRTVLGPVFKPDSLQ